MEHSVQNLRDIQVVVCANRV